MSYHMSAKARVCNGNTCSTMIVADGVDERTKYCKECLIKREYYKRIRGEFYGNGGKKQDRYCIL